MERLTSLCFPPCTSSSQPLFTLFRALTQQALSAVTAAHPKQKDGTPSVTFTTVRQLVLKANLKGLASKIYRNHSVIREVCDNWIVAACMEACSVGNQERVRPLTCSR